MNVSVGQIATFYCDGYGHNMTWTIDGTDVKLISPEMIELHGIKVVTTEELVLHPSTYIFQSTLNITAICNNNYTTIQCLLRTCTYQVSSDASLKAEGTNNIF